MPAVTYLTDIQIEFFSKVIGDAELNDQLQEVRKLTGDEWLIESQFHEERKRWFTKKVPAFWSYRLYYLLPGTTEAQIISLRSSGLPDETLKGYPRQRLIVDYSPGESRALISNFLMGIINGYADCRDTKDEEIRQLREALYLFREFVNRNATQWRPGAGNHNHPMWLHISTLLGMVRVLNSGPEYRFVQHTNKKTLRELRNE